ncbi:hypothetical protein GOP47_0022639 [Adiantum capillus-veneris]|uniref:J domain-containing protein n=1 Tax=Adiantum capillus-veneris TaxID=13818 RepID=A0A9D4U6N6_ADICA|nr:hypothetical protein GOP47_0022639 [Adiantum capillus-veneris]
MSFLKKTLLCWSSKQLRPHGALQSSSSYASQVQDAGNKRAFVEKAKCSANDGSHPIKDNCLMVGLAEHGPSAFHNIPLNMDMGISHMQRNTYVCSSYATTSGLKSRIFSMKLTRHVQTLSTQTRTSKAQCWSCGRTKSEKGFLLCPSCNAVQAPDPDITYFEIFDQDQKFEMDLKDLETKYKSLMKRLHPDLTHGKSTEENENYAHWSALVTAAYTVLLKPVSRATYLLKLRGIHVEEEGTVTDSELIMEVMEIRETLQSKPTKDVLEQLNKQAMARMDEWSRAFKTALEEGNDTAAVGALQRMSYFGRVCEDINRELL